MKTISMQAPARVTLVALVTIGLMGLLPSSRAAAPRLPPAGHGDAVLYLATIERLRGGTDYYSALGTELRRLHYPTTKVFNWRTPAHLEMIAALSVPFARGLLRALTLGILIVLPLALAHESATARIVGFLALLGALATAVKPQAAVAGEVWSGALIACSLCAYYRHAWKTAALTGAAALFMRELAAPYCVVCALAAFRCRRRSESVIWIVAAVAYVAYFGLHAVHVWAHQQPGDLSQDQPWTRWNGLRFVAATVAVNGWLTAAPQWVTALYIVVALAGTTSVRVPPQVKVPLWTYTLLFAFVGQPFNYYWGLVTAPLWAFAAAHGVEGLLGLVTRARTPAEGVA